MISVVGKQGIYCLILRMIDFAWELWMGYKKSLPLVLVERS